MYVRSGFTDRRLVSVDRDSAAVALDLPPADYTNPRIAPGGRRLLVVNGASPVEVLDLERGTRSRLTSAALGTSFSMWSMDGSRVVFRRFNLPFWVTADGGADPVLLAGATFNDFPSAPGPDPDSVLVVRVRPESSADVYLMSISGKFEPKPLVVTPAYEGGSLADVPVECLGAIRNLRAALSGARSAVAGLGRRRSPNSKEIYYRSGKRIVAVPTDASGVEPTFGKPTALFADDYEFGGVSIANYDVTPDGRFIMLRRGANGGKLRVVVNWTEELKQILATGGVR